MSYTLDQAASLERIKFPEFVAQLLNGTFDAVIAAQIKQMEAYSQFTKDVSKTLTEYINDTKSEISLEEIQDFLGTILLKGGNSALTLLPKSNNIEKTDLIVFDANNQASDIQTLNTALGLNAGTINTNSNIGSLLDAIAQKIASNKYSILKEMVNMGFSKLQFSKILVESNLMFSTWESEYRHQVSQDTSDRNFGANLNASFGRKRVLSGLRNSLGIAANLNYSQVKVSTNTSSTGQSTSTNINISGKVSIEAIIVK
ncbi:MAG: hypothetical protein LUM44_10265 [Pyrinomonadaceae bacterium]|nr:hypothetical protein [Pyrinomonadaceae bacterium]